MGQTARLDTSQARNRRERKAKGLCQHCGEAFNSELHRTRCLTRTSASRQFYTSRGLCRDCKHPLSSSEHERQCLLSRRNRNGICPKCKSNVASAAHSKCKAQHRASKRKLYRKALETGTCPGHSGRLTVIKGKCEECWYRAMSRSALGSKADWTDLRKLMVDQNSMCALTGERLEPGVNASVDHIRPIARGGSRSIANIQWVTFAVNKLKDSLTTEEFLLVCRHNVEKPMRDDPYSKLYERAWGYHEDNY